MVYLDKKIFLKGLESYNKSYVFALLDENKSILSATDYFEKPFSLKNNVLTIKGYKGNVIKNINGTAKFLALLDKENNIIFYKTIDNIIVNNNNYDFCLNDINIIFEGIEC